ncbi:hypothetical protein PPTG_03159 [Phytophthora nicotianae INRA-310]|uniref:RxLR effector protein n=1 Tax=Phytophthora nicotianae (strain INRA-310) TaxID=761204 RepID=W2R480_PHYN3|nr:hypothetical protein PPTG_03159 [Phytophthora nicotianae INRA-310]ETN20071.1 hypothetical protein PPTG_03159 [Phytophthora nicotianae INRA-310]
MSSLQLFVLVVLGLCCAAASSLTNVDPTNIYLDTNVMVAADHKQGKRSLRQYTAYDLDEGDSEDEERGVNISEQLDGVLSKVDDAVGKAGKAPSKLDALIMKNVDEFAKFADEHARLSKELFGKYPRANELSLSTLRQLEKIEKVREMDIKNGLKGNKVEPDGMRRKIVPFPGMKIAPEQDLLSKVGRDTEHYKTVGGRALAAGIVTRTNGKGEHEILLISSSNPEKYEFLIPKGGVEKGEEVRKAAVREVVEESGVKADIVRELDKIKISEEKSIQPYLMKSDVVYDDWSESLRHRLWVPYKDAINLLDNRPQMLEMVKGAKKHIG